METEKFDYVICGGGASGMLLANGLVSDSFFSNKKILLVEKDSKAVNDRTWCFWEKSESELEHIVSKKWNSAIFKANNFKKKFETSPYRYKLIRGIDFYNNFKGLKSKHNNLSYLK